MALTKQPPSQWRRRRRRKHPLSLLLPLLLTLLFAVLTTAQDDFLYNTPLDALFPAAADLNNLALGAPYQPLSRRQSQGTTTPVQPLRDGIPGQRNLLWGWEVIYHFPASEIFSSGATGKKNVFLTFNTCLQPNGRTDAALDPPALQVYVSNTTANRSPGPGVKGKFQIAVPVDQGFGALDFNATGDVWVGVSAPELPTSRTSMYVSDTAWNFELVLSTEKPYHGYIEDQFLYLVDTDDSTALLITGNMTATSSLTGGVDETMSDADLLTITSDDGYPYQMFAQNKAQKSRFSGLEKSYCAVRQHAQKKAGDTDVSITTRGMGGLPKQQFLMKELNRSSSYYGYLTRPADPKSGTLEADTQNTAGILWKPMELHTKIDGNCRIIYDLPFCSEAAYAVPSNPTLSQFGDAKNLTAFYDGLAELWWGNFSVSLQQIQCNASSDASYSLVRNCDDCAAAYKNWLCAVTIPRCMDYSSDLPYLAPRSESKLFWNGTAGAWAKHAYTTPLTDEEEEEWQRETGTDTPLEKAISRNQEIDRSVMPGPYKEIKPCKDLCWKLMQDCPSSLGFACPQEGSRGLEMSYGERDPSGDVTCSYLGAVYFLSAAGRAAAAWSPAVVAVLVAAVVVLW